MHSQRPSSRGRRHAVPAFLSYGFRPFFLGAAAWAALAVPLWLLILVGRAGLPAHLPPTLWHGHELLFGYAAAVLAGFLLTATPSWGKTAPLQGAPLLTLAALWLFGRLAAAFGALAPVPAALIELAFLPALALAIAPALRQADRRNLVFLPLLGALLLANLAVHLDALDVLPGAGSTALRLALDLFVLLIALVGGRVVPAFTANTLKAKGRAADIRPFGLSDRLALGALVAMALADLAGLVRPAGALALLAAALNLARMRGWRTRQTLDQPILWVLHLGYGWLVLGLAWKGAVELLQIAPPPEALHGLAIGAVGTMTLGIMSRAALGHTGRPLEVHRAIGLGYLLVSAAALLRLAAALLPGAWYLAALGASGAFWTLAFGLFLVVYLPVLVRPRVDQPG